MKETPPAQGGINPWLIHLFDFPPLAADRHEFEVCPTDKRFDPLAQMILFFVILGARPGAAGKVLATLFSVHAKYPF